MYLDDVKRTPTCGLIEDEAERIAFMQKYHLRRRAFVVAAVLMLLSGAAPIRASGASTVVAPVQQLIDGLLQIMKAGPGTPFQQRFATLGPVIDKTFDLAAILQESVGSAWAALPPDQQTMLTDAFRRYTVASYVNSFDDQRPAVRDQP